MSLRLPLLIGISGKRLFDKTNAVRDEEISQWVRERFDTIFQKLEDDYPETPKIILTGAAFGTDMIAAEAALAARARSANLESWAIVAILPFDRALFEEDFRQRANDPHGPGWTERYLAHARKFADLMAQADQDPLRPSVAVRELPKLRVVRPADGNPDGATATAEQLTRSNGEFQELRSNHYEQVGQFIAESATIMIAVMPGNGPADQEIANGGTARVVAYRRTGRPDGIGTKVARSSEVLRSEWSDLVAPPAKFVWLIDLAGYPANAKVSGYPVKALSPLFEPLLHKIYQKEPARTPPEEEDGARHMRASLALAEALKGFHVHVDDNGAVVADVSDTTDLPHAAMQVRGLINEIQVKTNKASRHAFWLLAILFVLAIFTFEIQSKFFPRSPWVMGLYILMLIGIGIVVYAARWGRWQSISDDYRAVAEMLRVQEAWWSAGIRERVDREHLQNTDRSLARIRDIATTLTAWLVLRRGWSAPLQPRWRDVIEGWVGGQLGYFEGRTEDREDKVHLTDAVSWTLFVASGFLALVVFVWLLEAWCDSHHVFHFFENTAAFFRPAILHVLPWDLGVIIWFALACFVVYVRALTREAKHGSAMLLTLGLGAITCFCVATGLVSVVFAFGDHSASEETLQFTAKSAVAVSLVGLSAIAGAWRYLTERLNVEAEAHEYHDAHQRFERARHALDVDEQGMPKDPEQARRTVHELGRLALTENEAWLKSRRERPLTPVVG